MWHISIPEEATKQAAVGVTYRNNVIGSVSGQIGESPTHASGVIGSLRIRRTVVLHVLLNSVLLVVWGSEVVREPSAGINVLFARALRVENAGTRVD